MIPWWNIFFGEPELRKLNTSVYEKKISQGAVTEEFEKKFSEILDIPYAVATTSGSVALLMSLMALEIGRNDEVIIPNRTWIATAHAALFLGAKIILVDVNFDIPTIDVKQITKYITPRTKAIIPVHLNGRSADLIAINNIAREHGLFVIEDACQAMFSRNFNGYLGTQSDIGCFSLGITKLISTGQGGIIVTKNKELYEKLKLIRNHGVIDNFTETWKMMGFNFKFTDLQASFGLAQLDCVSKRILHLKELYLNYTEKLSNLSFIKFVPINLANEEVPLYVEVMTDQRKELINYLCSHEIQARPVPPNINISPYIKANNVLPNSNIFSKQGMYLPCGPNMNIKNANKVIKVLHKY